MHGAEMKQTAFTLSLGMATMLASFGAAAQQAPPLPRLNAAGASAVLPEVRTNQLITAPPVVATSASQPLDQFYQTASNSSQRGDYRTAVAAYERMLAINPSLDRVRLDLGLAYARLGEMDLARMQFHTVLQHDVPEKVRYNIEEALKQIDKIAAAGGRVTGFNGSVATGLLFETNGNSSPNKGNVLVQDFLFKLEGHDRKRADGQAFATATLGYTKAFTSVPVDWKSSGSYYQTVQNKLHQLDLKIASVNTGPVYHFKDGVTTADMNAGYTNVILDGHTYLQDYSADAGIERKLTPQLTGRVSYRAEYRDFFNAPGVTIYDDRTGFAQQVKGGIIYALNQNDLVDASFVLRKENAKEDHFSNRQLYPLLGYTHTWGDGYYVRGEASYRDSNYDAPDPIISAKERRDRETTLDLTFGKAFANNISLTAGYEYHRDNSTLVNYDYDDHRVTTTLGWHF